MHLLLCLKSCKGLKGVAFRGKPISELQSVTCRAGLHNVTCHLTQMNAPHLSPSQTGWNFDLSTPVVISGK